jgi:hypothetical protein
VAGELETGKLATEADNRRLPTGELAIEARAGEDDSARQANGSQRQGRATSGLARGTDEEAPASQQREPRKGIE